jgi:5'-nucleotidase (lipoprotein e(P4) family)
MRPPMLVRSSPIVLGCMLAGALACRSVDAPNENNDHEQDHDHAAFEQRIAALEAENLALTEQLETERGCRAQVIGSLTAFAESPYPELTTAAFERAQTLLAARVRKRKRGEKLAIVLDVDETALSNFEQLQGSGFCFVREQWNQWVDVGEPTILAGARPLYDYARKHQVAVVFLTGRSEDQREDTERVLRDAGLEPWDHLLLRDEAERKLSAAEYKSSRRAKLEAEGFTIALVVGDQHSDLEGGHGEHTVLIPNPFYHVK